MTTPKSTPFITYPIVPFTTSYLIVTTVVEVIVEAVSGGISFVVFHAVIPYPPPKYNGPQLPPSLLNHTYSYLLPPRFAEWAAPNTNLIGFSDRTVNSLSEMLSG